MGNRDEVFHTCQPLKDEEKLSIYVDVFSYTKPLERNTMTCKKQIRISYDT